MEIKNMMFAWMKIFDVKSSIDHQTTILVFIDIKNASLMTLAHFLTSMSELTHVVTLSWNFVGVGFWWWRSRIKYSLELRFLMLTHQSSFKQRDCWWLKLKVDFELQKHSLKAQWTLFGLHEWINSSKNKCSEWPEIWCVEVFDDGDSESAVLLKRV